MRASICVAGRFCFCSFDRTEWSHRKLGVEKKVNTICHIFLVFSVNRQKNNSKQTLSLRMNVILEHGWTF